MIRIAVEFKGILTFKNNTLYEDGSPVAVYVTNNYKYRFVSNIRLLLKFELHSSIYCVFSRANKLYASTVAPKLTSTGYNSPAEIVLCTKICLSKSKILFIRY